MDPNVIQPTLVPYPNFNATEDAKQLRFALRDDPQKEVNTVIEILTTRVEVQRNEIASEYQRLFKRDLYQDVKTIYTGKFSKLMRALIKPTFDYLASVVNKAMAGLGTDEDVLTEVLCTRSNTNISLVAEAFKRQFGVTIDEELQTEYKVSAEYKEIIAMLISGIRNEQQECNEEKAKKRAENIYAAESGMWSTETKIFMRVLTHESYPQLRLIFDEYQKISGHTMEEGITKEFSGDLRMAMKAIVKCAKNRSLYYAEKLEKAMGRLCFDDHAIIRIISTRSEIDLGAIKTEYANLYNKSLYSQIGSRTSGDYRTALLKLIGED